MSAINIPDSDEDDQFICREDDQDDESSEQSEWEEWKENDDARRHREWKSDQGSVY